MKERLLKGILHVPGTCHLTGPSRSRTSPPAFNVEGSVDTQACHLNVPAALLRVMLRLPRRLSDGPLEQALLSECQRLPDLRDSILLPVP